MKSRVVFSKKSDDWTTPPALLKELVAEYGCTFDPCPLHADFDGLQVNWGKSCFINPPYSNIKAFLEKGINEMSLGHTHTLVYLIPARTDTRWFHDLVLGKAKTLFIKGRLKFGDGKNSAPFPSMIVVYKKEGEHNGRSEAKDNY